MVHLLWHFNLRKRERERWVDEWAGELTDRMEE